MSLKYKHIEASREVRLWIGQVVIPLVGLVVLSDDYLRNKLNEGVGAVKNGIKELISKQA